MSKKLPQIFLPGNHIRKIPLYIHEDFSQNRMKDISNMVKLAQQKDPEGFRLIYEQYSNYLFGVCKRYLNTQEDAEEALSDAFIQAFKKIDQLQDAASLRAWLKTIVIRTCLAIVKKKKLEVEDIDLNVGKIYDQEDALSNLSLEELKSYIDDLPLGYKSVFNLYFIEGYNHKEIADMLSISTGTSKSQLSKARKRLQMTIINNRELPNLIAL